MIDRITPDTVDQVFAGFKFPDNRELARQTRTEAVRKVPIQDYKSIIYEYYDLSKPRSYNFIGEIAQRYHNTINQKQKSLSGVIEKICMNWFDTLPDSEYNALRLAWEEKYPNYRSEIIKQAYADGRRTQAGPNISAAKATVDPETAEYIYTVSLSGADTRTNVHYKALAKHLDISSWQLVRDIANGNYYCLSHKDVSRDIEQWRLTLHEGNYEMIDPVGNSHVFNTLHEMGYFIQTSEGKSNSDQTKNWFVARNWVEKIQPNVWYKKQRRTFKGWEYCNHLPAKQK
jgi:hypothetical protein